VVVVVVDPWQHSVSVHFCFSQVLLSLLGSSIRAGGDSQTSLSPYALSTAGHVPGRAQHSVPFAKHAGVLQYTNGKGSILIVPCGQVKVFCSAAGAGAVAVAWVMYLQDCLVTHAPPSILHGLFRSFWGLQFPRGTCSHGVAQSPSYRWHLPGGQKLSEYVEQDLSQHCMKSGCSIRSFTCPGLSSMHL